MKYIFRHVVSAILKAIDARFHVKPTASGERALVPQSPLLERSYFIGGSSKGVATHSLTFGMAVT